MKKITLCADDYGQNKSISQAILALLEKNRLSATSCMTSSPAWSLYAEWLRPFSGQSGLGLHFNLTEGQALSHGFRFLSLPQLILKAYGRLLDEPAIEAELDAQLDAFLLNLGKLPDFIDGHQHVHQLPMIRDIVCRVYEKRLRGTGCYIRSTASSLRLGSPKALIIQALGARAFKNLLGQHKIPFNSSFAGIYPFAASAHYSRIFPRFLAQIQEGGIIMCHPGLQSSDKTDAIAASRYNEFLYLESEQFVRDCFLAGVLISTQKTNL
ncbi:MAG TPA: ChbG/HpnK family deacetylase [Gammaproteobacteria bacterium]|nr:ChbG/HpnK family deacetylase [Gammaproteobacteria bacterium]